MQHFIRISETFVYHDPSSLYELLKQQFLKSTVPASNLAFSARQDPKSPYDFHFYHCFSKPNEFNNYISISHVCFRASKFLQFKSSISFLFWKSLSFHIDLSSSYFLICVELGVEWYFHLSF